LDAKGQKMSKSKGNVINPLDLTEKYGTDAFRMGMVIGNTPGTSLSLSEDKIKGQKHFANKVWNIARFIKTSTEKIDNISTLSPENQTIIDTFNTLIQELTKEMEDFRFYLVSEKLYNFIWHELADKLLEESKALLSGTDKQSKKEKSFVLNYIFKNCLKMLHPFMPFITEELWSIMEYKDGERMLIVENWPMV
jgi:valyl-tRNA synthetase